MPSATISTIVISFVRSNSGRAAETALRASLVSFQTIGMRSGARHVFLPGGTNSVAGAYGHSRFREWILGGVTKRLVNPLGRCSLLSR